MAAGQNVFKQVLGGPGALEGVRDMEVVGTSVAVEEIEEGGAQQFRDQGLHVQVQAGDLEKG